VSDTTAGAGAPEYLEVGRGEPLPPGPPAPPAAGGGRRRGLLIAGGIAALGVVGVGAWAAAQFFATGAQPAEALPATTMGYASIDLDPSGGQKIEALRTLNKFPAFKEEFGLDADDDIRKAIFDELNVPEECQLSYDEDIEPWLGDRMAVAAVDLGDEQPEIVGVIQVKDAEAADDGLKKIRDCGSDGDTSGGWVIDGDWAIVADDVAGAQAAVDATDDGTLADDPEFKELNSAAGSAGFVSLYAAPEAGKYLEETIGGMSGYAEGFEEGLTGTDAMGELSNAAPAGSSPLADFGGMAVTVRFDDGALEIEGAGDTGVRMSKLYSTDRGADVVETLPPATAAAFGLGFEEGWLTQLAEQVAASSGGEMTAADLFEEASDATGLDVPEDIETLFGSSAALAFGSDFDPEAFFNSGKPTDLPIALKVQGDEEAARKVLTKLLDQAPPETAQYLGLDSDEGYFVIGPNTEFRTGILGRADLGSTEIYQDVIRESDKASSVVFVNFNAGDDWLVKLAGDDPTVAENVKPLAAFGVTTWQDDDYTHGVLRLTTD
jgi:Protein of unknown function (DUF3352)